MSATIHQPSGRLLWTDRTAIDIAAMPNGTECPYTTPDGETDVTVTREHDGRFTVEVALLGDGVKAPWGEVRGILKTWRETFTTPIAAAAAIGALA